MISGSFSKVNSDDEQDIVPSSDCLNCPIVEEPRIHLASYSKRYTDVARLLRLKFIAQVCPKLRVEALELAINHVKSTYNVKMYEELHKIHSMEVERSVKSSKAISSSNTSIDTMPTCSTSQPNRAPCKALPYDSYWVEDNTMEATLLLQELDAELNFKKSNSGSTYVRRILEEIGDYHVKSGNLHLAIKYYARARPYCTSSDHVINMFRNLIRVSIYMANWWHVLSYIDEAKHYAAGFQNLAQSVPAQLSCAAGLANIGLKIYKTAAHCFLLTPFDHYDYHDIVAQQDVAYYGGLCGLATLDIEMLQLGCLESETFKPFIAISHRIWDLIANFISGDLDNCVKQLQEIESHVRLDVYMAPHVDALYGKIKTRMRDRKSSITERI
ncbi:COP9 signalosome complex subunit 1 [Drosophila nasuta]|uniref:COP9 signalosome complex subunit 1 n=1 Tax=Drosophila nasuta TaxID=42062 RepID=UPI00295E3BA6|nr:COP9 signalosome complex subunit 1 [Drosophila nasuta]